MKRPRAELIAELRELTESELVEVLYEALRPSNRDRAFPNGDFEYERWCLAQTSFGRFGKTDAEAYIELAALPAPGWELPNVHSLFQQGRCGGCGTLVTSVAKLAICPVCSKEVECT